MKKKWIGLTLLVNALLCFTASLLYIWHYTGWSLQQNIRVVVAGVLATLFPENLMWFVHLIHCVAIGVLIYLVFMDKWSKSRFAILHIVMAAQWIWTTYYAKEISSW